MAEQLARIFGTEEDRVNCPFYFKIGACRNGDQCNRLHNRPTMSQTLLLSHMYPNTPESLALANDEPWDDDMYDRAQAHLEAFYVEVFLELANYGEIEDLVVVDNLCDHMIGNVYVETQGSKSNAGGKEGKGRRSSTRTEDNEADSKDPAVSPAAPTSPSAPSASPSASASPAESPPAEAEGTKATQEAPKSKRASASPQATNPVVASGLPEVLAPVALDDATPSTTDFVLLRPLPYEPIPPDAGDSNKQRTFVFKGNLVVVPMLPLLSPREGSPKSAKQPPKNEDVRQNKGWKMVKSKVVGGAMKAE